ncbi:MAG: class I SAM-dependent methyltransferase [Armatimonadetes bacterium]|nr:class I SAM-dependent methyltransferase [Armatimonadota bacterium]
MELHDLPADTGPERYSGGYSAHVLGGLSRRTAEREAAFYLPYLRAGMRLLDCGCGPGSLTVDLAQRVAPGAVVGLDLEADQFALAEARARERGARNVTFRQGSLYELPFEDGAFDAVFAHAVLYHLSRPERALEEICRVLAPGGVVGLRDWDFAGDVWHPALPEVDRAMQLAARTVTHLGGNPAFGRTQQAALRAAGFEVVGLSASSEVFSAHDRAPGFAKYWADHFLVEHTELIQQEGWATETELAYVRDGLHRWGAHPDAFYARCRCEAVARKPEA